MWKHSESDQSRVSVVGRISRGLLSYEPFQQHAVHKGHPGRGNAQVQRFDFGGLQSQQQVQQFDPGFESLELDGDQDVHQESQVVSGHC